MVKGFKKRICAVSLAFFITFAVCSADYLEVQALEWAGTVVGFDTAIKFVLGLLGVSVAGGVASQIDWNDVYQDAVDYQLAQGNTQVEVSRWWADVIHGGLNTASSCWTAFKAWVKNDLLSSSGSGGAVVGNSNLLEVCQSVLPNLITSNLDSYEYSYALYTNNRDSTYNFYFIPSCTYRISGSNFYFQSDTYKRANNIRPSDTNINFYNQNTTSEMNFSINSTYQIYLYNFSGLTLPNEYFHIWDLSSSTPILGDFESAVSDIGNIALAPDTATDIPYDGTIPIPWENVGATDTAIDNAIEQALDKVMTGAWTLEQYWTWTQNVTNVFAYDTTNNFLLPNDGDDEKADDKVQQNINRGSMVLYGLEKVFPFCIPWDIYAFITLLVAEPVAPVIEYPIYNPVTQEDEIITIDFSIWEEQVILLRYIQDFLFIIGLLFLARSLIGAGGSD